MSDKIIIILMALLLGITSVYDASDASTGFSTCPAYTSNSSTLEPYYRIVPILSKGVINPGESFNITLQITGGGEIKENKLVIYFPQEFLSTTNSSKECSFLGGEENSCDKTKKSAVWYEEPACTDINRGMAIGHLVQHCFMDADTSGRTIHGELKSPSGNPPIILKVVSNENAPRGDNIIRIIFSYNDGKRWYMYNDDVVIHVREWYELQQFETPEQTFIIAILSIFGAAIIAHIANWTINHLLKPLWNWIKNHLLKPLWNWIKNPHKETISTDKNEKNKTRK